MARAIRAVSSGTGSIACGCNDIGSLLAVRVDILYFSPVSHISLLPIRQQYLSGVLPSIADHSFFQRNEKTPGLTGICCSLLRRRTVLYYNG